MSDLVGNPNCWFSHAQAQLEIIYTAYCFNFKAFGHHLSELFWVLFFFAKGDYSHINIMLLFKQGPMSIEPMSIFRFSFR